MTKKDSSLAVDLKDLRQQMAGTEGTIFYSKGGIQISPAWWDALYSDRQYRLIAKNKFEDITITTVWDGIDNRKDKTTPPPIFEVRIENSNHFWTWHCCNLAMVEIVHALLLRQLREGTPPEELTIQNPYN